MEVEFLKEEAVRILLHQTMIKSFKEIGQSDGSFSHVLHFPLFP